MVPLKGLALVNCSLTFMGRVKVGMGLKNVMHYCPK